MEAQLPAMPRISINLLIVTLIDVWNNESFNLWFWRGQCLRYELSISDIIGKKEVFSFSVSHSKLLLSLIVG